MVTTRAPAALPDRLRETAERLEGGSPEDVLRWALDTYGTCMALACSFGGPSGMVLLDLALALEPRLPVFYLDTGLLFPETYALIETVADRYGISPIAVRPALSVTDQATAH